MKIRSDFVSNSSSSSFVMIGAKFNSFQNFINDLCKDDPETLQKYHNEEIDWYDVLEKKIKEPLTWNTSGYDGDIDGIAVGIDPSSQMKNDETLKEFKEKVQDELDKCGIKCDISKIEFLTGGSDAGGSSWIE